MKGSYSHPHIMETRTLVSRQGTEERCLPRVLVDAFPDGLCGHVSTMMEVDLSFQECHPPCLSNTHACRLGVSKISLRINVLPVE
jgi:hypothetical protein